MLEALRELVCEVAPRRGQDDIGPDTDLGFRGYGMTIPEYLTFRQRVEQRWDMRFGSDVWPLTLAEIATCLEAS